MSDTAYYPALFTRPRLIHIVMPDRSWGEELSVVFRLEGFETALSATPEAFLAAVRQRVPDAAIVSLGQVSGTGIDLVSALRLDRFRTLAFLLIGEPDLTLAVAGVRAGAVDVFARPLDHDHLVRRIRDALRAAIRIEMAEGEPPVMELSGLARLTPRERQVLDLVANGFSNKQAGRELGISPRTIEVHRARIMEKLGARNTADLLRLLLTG